MSRFQLSHHYPPAHNA